MQALVDYGFLYVINHGIDEATMKSVYAESKKFFEQPMEEKMALEKNSSHRGYIRPDFEGFEADAGGKGENMIYHASIISRHSSSWFLCSCQLMFGSLGDDLAHGLYLWFV